MKKINIAFDGPSAAGKSTIADILAEKLGYVHLNTGSMYRAVALDCLNNNISLEDEEKIVEQIEKMELVMEADGSVILYGEDVSLKIRENEISLAASDVSKHEKVRAALVAMQQKISEGGGYILDGRDIGTVVLKDAEVKVYLTATAHARAVRRIEQNKELGIPSDYDTILKEIEQRDYQDMHREHSPLTKADDAVEIDSSDLTIDQVVEKCMELVEEKLK